MARQHAALLVDEDRDVESEGRNAVGDAGDLPGGMHARVSLVRDEGVEGQPADRKPRGRSIPIGHEGLPFIGSEAVRQNPRSAKLRIVFASPRAIKNEKRTKRYFLLRVK